MDLRRYVLTGTPSAGKTTLAHVLRARGLHVIDEAATDVIAESPHERPSDRPDFVDLVVHRQHRRQVEAVAGPIQVFDRSPLCTLALARYAGLEPTAALTEELARIERERVYQRLVFLVQPIGFVTPTAVRRITYEQSLTFARIHEEVYREHGYDLFEIPPGTVADRAAMIEARLT